MTLVRENLKCPWQRFEDCLKTQCPFYGEIVRIHHSDGGYDSELGCKRAAHEVGDLR